MVYILTSAFIKVFKEKFFMLFACIQYILQLLKDVICGLQLRLGLYVLFFRLYFFDGLRRFDFLLLYAL